MALEANSKTGMQPAVSEPAAPVSLPWLARWGVILGLVLAALCFIVVPLAIVATRDAGWYYLVGVVWLILPAIALSASLREWYGQRRVGATADVIITFGITSVWLFLVAASVVQVEDLDLGWLPYVVAVALLGSAILSFFAFLRLVSEGGDFARSSGLSWLYWTLFVASLAVIGLSYFVTLYFQIIMG